MDLDTILERSACNQLMALAADASHNPDYPAEQIDRINRALDARRRRCWHCRMSLEDRDRAKVLAQEEKEA